YRSTKPPATMPLPMSMTPPALELDATLTASMVTLPLALTWPETITSALAPLDAAALMVTSWALMSPLTVMPLPLMYSPRMDASPAALNIPVEMVPPWMVMPPLVETMSAVVTIPPEPASISTLPPMFIVMPERLMIPEPLGVKVGSGPKQYIPAASPHPELGSVPADICPMPMVRLPLPVAVRLETLVVIFPPLDAARITLTPTSS